MKYHLITLGCQMNKSDSERVRTVIEGMGYIWTDLEEEANLLGILSCSVRQKSIDKVYARIRKWNSWKNNRNLLTFASGCILPLDREKFMRQFDLLFSIDELPGLPDMIRQYGVVTPSGSPAAATKEELAQKRLAEGSSFTGILPGKTLSVIAKRPDDKIRDFWRLRPTFSSGFEAFIPIQNGCDKFCTFCAVPYTRGREISRPSAEILEELKKLVESGCNAITLLGQNVNSYGLDREGKEISFQELLRRIGEYGKNSSREFWVYFTSPHPRDMAPELLEVIATYDCLAKQIHLPLQSGDNKVLIRMNRKHSYEDYRNIIANIRKILPQATIFTDIIVGFAGETDEQFENTRKAMEELKFNMAYIAVYSPRPGVASSRWDDDVPMHVKKHRLHILTEELVKSSQNYNNTLMGREIKVLVTGHDRKPGFLSGITEGRIVVRFQAGETIQPGTFVWLKITSAASYSVEGELLPVNAAPELS
jgi:tRNA-2-methylthio-N6-dimethylallyladenosine synthase